MPAASWPEFLAQTHFADLATLLAGLAAVGLVGLSKGGLGGAFALLGVPVLVLVMPPVQAAALLLPLPGRGGGVLACRARRDKRHPVRWLPPPRSGTA